jgi:23S rRNA pseudouridine1911/1915/1917 synthase
VYLAIVHGRAPRRGEVSAAIGRDPHDRKRMAVRASGGRAALSRFRLLEALAGASLLEVEIATGRTHQIRVHLAALGHPVVGDRVYGRGRQRPAAPALLEFPRQALHAVALAFRHPATREPLLFRAPLPMDMERLLDELRRAAPESRSS